MRMLEHCTTHTQCLASCTSHGPHPGQGKDGAPPQRSSARFGSPRMIARMPHAAENPCELQAQGLPGPHDNRPSTIRQHKWWRRAAVPYPLAPSLRDATTRSPGEGVFQECVRARQSRRRPEQLPTPVGPVAEDDRIVRREQVAHPLNTIPACVVCQVGQG